MSSGKDSGREAKKRSKDTWQSNTGYFFGAVFRCLFLISLNLEKTVRILAAPNVKNLHPRGGQERQLKQCTSKVGDNRFSMTSTTLSIDSVYE